MGVGMKARHTDLATVASLYVLLTILIFRTAFDFQARAWMDGQTTSPTVAGIRG